MSILIMAVNVGDSVTYEMRGWSRTETVLVDTVYYETDFRGKTRKVIGFMPLMGRFCGDFDPKPLRVKWIEGLGNNTSLTEALPICGISHVPWFNLKCVFDDQTKIFGDTVQKCFSQKLSQVEYAHQKIQIHPNPVTNKLYLQSEWPITQAILLSFNGAILKELYDVQDDIDVSALKPGIYILQLMNSEGQIGRYKVVKED